MFKSWRPFLPLLLLFLHNARATHPEHRTTATAEEFLKGDFKGVAVTSDGKLVLAPAFDEIIDTSEAFIHSVSSSASGTLFLGTGSNGKIFRVPAGGAGGEFAKLEEPAVYALAISPQSNLYAASSPDGKVYRLDSDGKAEVFFDPGQKFIWDLVFDEAGVLYVATGPGGVIYKVDPEGKGQELFDSEETHIVSLGFDLNKNLLAGSAPGGLLYRVSTTGRPFVLLDSVLEEVSCFTVDRYGNVFAGAISGGGAVAAEKSASKPKQNNDATVESLVKTAGKTNGGRLEVYKIDKENMVETLYASDDEIAFDLHVRNDGSLILATGNKGRILVLSPTGFSTLLVDTDEEQVTHLLEKNGELLLATSNLGKLFRLGGEIPSEGVFESDVLDAGMVARWGSIRWRIVDPVSPDSVRFFSRSGNTGKPDRTWSDWEGPYSKASGTQIGSPSTRYLQWKIEFTPGPQSALLSQRDAVDQVTVTYQQNNMAPKLDQLNVLSPGVAFARVPVNPAGGVRPGGPDGSHAQSLPRSIRNLDTPKVTPPSRKIYIPGVRSFSWKASDPNQDSLLYRLYYRREEDRNWILLKDELTRAEYTIDGASFPDGVYLVRVVASDRLSNPKDQALEDDIISKPFVIANSAPSVDWKPVEVQGKTARLRFTVNSNVSPVYQVEYAVDGGPWEVLFSEDGITDSRSEEFAVTLENLNTGQRNVRIRVVDTVGNLGTAIQSFRVD